MDTITTFMMSPAGILVFWLLWVIIPVCGLLVLRHNTKEWIGRLWHDVEYLRDTLRDHSIEIEHLKDIISELEERHDTDINDIATDYRNLQDEIDCNSDDITEIKELLDAGIELKEICGECEQLAECCRSSCKVCEESDTGELPIHLISWQEFAFNAAGRVETYTLIYDEDSNELLFGDYPERFVIDNAEDIIGDALTYFGVNSGDPRTVYVRNHRYGADFKIVTMSKYLDNHIG